MLSSFINKKRHCPYCKLQLGARTIDLHIRTCPQRHDTEAEFQADLPKFSTMQPVSSSQVLPQSRQMKKLCTHCYHEIDIKKFDDHSNNCNKSSIIKKDFESSERSLPQFASPRRSQQSSTVHISSTFLMKKGSIGA